MVQPPFVQPKLKLLDITMIMVGFVVGMGIFRTPVNVAANSLSPFIFYGAWLAGGIVAICGALTYAEIGSRYPVTGGYYRIFSVVYHPSLAFAVNCIILVSNAASLAAVALVGAEYIAPVLFGPQADYTRLEIIIAIVCIVLFYGINLLGLIMSSRLQTILMLIKIGLVLLLITPIFFAEPAPSVSSSLTQSPTLMAYIKSFGLGLMAVSFTFGGYQQTINFGEEIHEPKKTMPRAILIGIILILILYMAINYAYVYIIGFEQLKTAENISAIMAEKVMGPFAGKVLSVLLFLGVLAYVNGSLLSNPRVMSAMGEDRSLPAVFAKRNAKTNALVYSLTAFAFIAVFVVFWAEEFDKILSFTMFLDCIGMALSAATIFKFRKTTAHLNGTGIYQMKLFPLLPIIFIAAYAFIGISIFIDKPSTALLGLLILFIFIGIYFLFHHRRKNGSVQA